MTELWKDKKDIPMFDENSEDKTVPSVDEYIIPNSRSCVVICPGGGYVIKSFDHEGIQIAKWFNSIGVSAMVLDYRLNPYKHPVPLYDVKRAIRYARSKAKEYGYDGDKIGVMGFSAGGHLAASAGTLKGDYGYAHIDETDELSARPDFMVLCYPVISFVEYAHYGSFVNLTAEQSLKTAVELSADKNVDSDTPPTFLWHTSGDNGVPVENSLNMAAALSRYKIPFEIHTFKDGPHGQGLCDDYPYSAMWIKVCENWMKSMNYIDD